MGERNQDGFGEGRGAGDDDRSRRNTSIGAENARREAAEREQREHPDYVAGRGRDTARESDTEDLDAATPIDADDDSERFRARENEDESEG